MIDEADRLDAALDHPGYARVDSDLARLVELAVEVTDALQRTWLTAEERSRLYARIVAAAERRSPWALARRVVSDHRLPAIAGGAAVTIAAGTAIAMAVARQHRGPAGVPA